MKINNMPEKPMGRFVVFRLVDGESWYLGDFYNYDKALEVAVEIGGQIIPTEYVEV